MPRLELADLARAVEGSLVRGDPKTVVDSFVINTRVLRPGGVFFALPGTRTDGHKFLAEAAKKGAAAAVVQREPAEDAAAPPALIRVDDTVKALASCGRWLRERLSGMRWIALTGSNGKTTTKELIAEGLSARYCVHRTYGNFNNHLGVPLSILACPDDAEIMVLELAMSGPGEIGELTSMTRPQIGLVTNVRAVHLKYFDSLDDIAAAKGELYAMLDDRATAVVNLDDVHVRVQASRHVGPRVTFGRHPDADLKLEEVVNRFLPGAAMAFRHAGKVRQVQLRLGGAHSAFNALAALAVVAAAGEDIDAAIEGMQRLEAGPGRGKIHQLDRGIVVVDDSYNSSPAALASVLDTLRVSETRGRKVLVMGDMLELGHVEGALHREAGKRAAAAGVQVLLTVGTLSRQSAESARRAGVPEVYQQADAGKAAETLSEIVRDGDLIVVKGSRKFRLEQVVKTLTEAT
jgi:UDP-N-acetylmuramoyl-tripeptide--D-alanyl-D-alanine ligase